MSKIYIASDHAGFALKTSLLLSLKEAGHDVEDCGAYALDERDDYPDVVRPCVEKVAREDGSLGIVCGASGQGEAMVANRVPNIRAIVYYGAGNAHGQDATGKVLDIVRAGRVHNNANVLSLGARFLTTQEAVKAATIFLETVFEGEERHVRRIEKIDQ